MVQKNPAHACGFCFRHGVDRYWYIPCRDTDGIADTEIGVLASHVPYLFVALGLGSELQAFFYYLDVQGKAASSKAVLSSRLRKQKKRASHYSLLWSCARDAAYAQRIKSAGFSNGLSSVASCCETHLPALLTIIFSRLVLLSRGRSVNSSIISLPSQNCTCRLRRRTKVASVLRVLHSLFSLYHVCIPVSYPQV